MKNLNQFLALAIDSKIITSEQKKQLIELANNKFPDSDIYKDDLIKESIELISLIEEKQNTKINLREEVLTHNSEESLDEVLTFSEATQIYSLGKTTLRRNVDYNRYLDGEVRLSAGTWLITKKAIERLYPHNFLKVKIEKEYKVK